jgi:hypothetical protein
MCGDVFCLAAGWGLTQSWGLGFGIPSCGQHTECEAHKDMTSACALPIPHIAGVAPRQIYTQFDYTTSNQVPVYALDRLEVLCPQ